MKNAGDVKVGDVVEFDAGMPVHSVERNWEDGEDPSDHARKNWGDSYVFSCSFDGVTADVHTLYVRRERSPLGGRYVVR